MNRLPVFGTAGRALMRSWVIGSRADCDVVVDSPLVSGRHCRLTQIPEGFVLEDLESTNGTFVDGVRITAPARVTPGESITLGKTLLLPWPPGVLTYIRIGRVADNDIVIDDPRVSAHHARLIVVDGAATMIEDLGSSNGTFLNSVDRRVTSPTRLNPTDTLYFGTMSIDAARLLAGRSEPAVPAQPRPSETRETKPGQPEAPVPAALASVGKNRWIVASLAQVPVVAIAIVLVFGSQAAAAITPSSWASVGQGIASTTFALAIAAIWFGSSLALAEMATARPPGRVPAAGLAKQLLTWGVGLVVVCALECAILLAIVHWGSKLGGPWLAMWGILVMASLVGLFLGLAVTSSARPAAAVAVLLAGFCSMIALGGCIWPLPAMSTPFRLAAAAMPSRWSFEGLLLLESLPNPLSTLPESAESVDRHDFAEAYFPIASDRMGPRADAIALGSMLIGLAALVVMIRAPASTGRE